MKNEFNDIIGPLMSKGGELGFYHLNTQDESFDGRHITVNGKELVFFSNCSYLGLDVNPAAKEAAIEAIRKYGINFSSSRITVSMGLYEELESLMDEIFGKPTYMAPSTSLAHIAYIPTMIDPGDAIIMDQQVHNSVKNAVQMVKPEGVHTEIVKHNRMDFLETRIQILKQTHKRVWYMCDSVYSMYGDVAPFSTLQDFLHKYEEFHLYVDDAHGMSWAGKNGRGFALSKMPYHPRMMMATSTGKGFGSGGGALIFNDQASKDMIKNCSGPNIFSGPLQPAVLGAAIACAKLHLTEEIDMLQNDLFERMFFFTQTAAKMGLPVVNNDLTPIFYIGAGKKEVSYKLSTLLQNEGYYVMTTSFPAVPLKNSGIRLTVHNHLELKDIHNILEVIADGMPRILREENISMEEIHEIFSIPQPGRELSLPVERRKIA